MSTEREYPAAHHARTSPSPALPHAPGCSVVVATALPAPAWPSVVVVRRSSGRPPGSRLSPTSTRHAACTEARPAAAPSSGMCVCVCVCACMHQWQQAGSTGPIEPFTSSSLTSMYPKRYPKRYQRTPRLRSYITKADSGLPSSLPSTVPFTCICATSKCSEYSRRCHCSLAKFGWPAGLVSANTR